jgi:hypothetical protein
VDDQAIRDLVWGRIAQQIDLNETPLEQARFWLLLGMRMQEADSNVAERIWHVMIPNPDHRAILQGKLDQASAMMRDLFNTQI